MKIKYLTSVTPKLIDTVHMEEEPNVSLLKRNHRIYTKGNTTLFSHQEFL